MMVLGFRASYEGRFGSVPVIQAGRFQLIQVKDYKAVPLPLAILLEQASQAGAQFLIIDPLAEKSEKANWIDIREAA